MGPLSPIRSHPTQCNPVHSNPIQSTTTHSNPTQCNTKQPNPIQQMHLAQDLSCEIVFQVLSKRLPPTVLNTLHPGWCQRRRRQRKFPRSPPSGCLKFNQISKPYYVMPTYSWLCAFMCSPPSHLIFQHTIVFQSPFQTFTGLSSMFRFLDCPLLFLSVPLQVEKAQPIRKYSIVEYESKCGKSDDGGKKGCCKKLKTNVHLLNLQSVENSKSCVLGLRCGE